MARFDFPGHSSRFARPTLKIPGKTKRINTPTMEKITLGNHTVSVFPTPEEACQPIADELTELLKTPAVLGLATGSSPLPLYAELVRRYQHDQLSFGKATTFNLDEYLGLLPTHPESYRYFMETNLFSHVDLDLGRANLPSGIAEDPEAEAISYEEKISTAGGIDWQLLGMGRNGHLGFNEPGSAEDSPTRVIKLHEVTRQDAAPSFGGLENTPERAITIGLRTILAAKRIVLIVWGAKKADILRQALTGPLTAVVPASFLQKHPNVSIFVDQALADQL